jgi:hypothetical protein
MLLGKYGTSELYAEITSGTFLKNWMKALFQDCAFVDERNIVDGFRLRFCQDALQVMASSDTERVARGQFAKPPDTQTLTYWLSAGRLRLAEAARRNSKDGDILTVEESLRRGYDLERWEIFELVLSHLGEVVAREQKWEPVPRSKNVEA